MTIPNHGIHTFTITHWITQDLPLSITMGVIAMIPDLIPVHETIRGVWRLYEEIHDFRWWMVLCPPYLLHILLDVIIHNHKTGKWFWWAYVMEVTLWVLCGFYFWGAFF